jgi:hypothetical protein
MIIACLIILVFRSIENGKYVKLTLALLELKVVIILLFTIN